jgi:hypothetical protein
MAEAIIRFVNLKSGELPPQDADWILLRLFAQGRYDLFAAEGIAHGSLGKPV